MESFGKGFGGGTVNRPDPWSQRDGQPGHWLVGVDLGHRQGCDVDSRPTLQISVCFEDEVRTRSWTTAAEEEKKKRGLGWLD